jgi:hypothetical protein
MLTMWGGASSPTHASGRSHGTKTGSPVSLAFTSAIQKPACVRATSAMGHTTLTPPPLSTAAPLTRTRSSPAGKPLHTAPLGHGSHVHCEMGRWVAISWPVSQARGKGRASAAAGCASARANEWDAATVTYTVLVGASSHRYV